MISLKFHHKSVSRYMRADSGWGLDISRELRSWCGHPCLRGKPFSSRVAPATWMPHAATPNGSSEPWDTGNVVEYRKKQQRQSSNDKSIVVTELSCGKTKPTILFCDSIGLCFALYPASYYFHIFRWHVDSNAAWFATCHSPQQFHRNEVLV